MENDLAAQGGAAYWLAYAHPAFMLAALGLALAALRLGLGLRSSRRLGARRDGRAYARHLRLAKLAVTLLPLGFAAGVASAVLLRGWSALGSAHGRISSAALVLFLGAALFGRKLERGAKDAHDTHALLAVLAALCAAASIFTGFVLLP
ncbi:MAG: DUF4079 family protein [Deltaproteobacteria bacterium]|nr:DUF4079 family protein [Deltaproteobacteria bacterium]